MESKDLLVLVLLIELVDTVQLIDAIMMFLQLSHLLPLAMVMLFDFQDRGFVKRERASREDVEPLPEVRDLEESLQRLCVYSFEVVQSGKVLL